MNRGDDNKSRKNTVRSLVWDQITERNTFELILSSVLLSLSFWKIATDKLSYAPSEYFTYILNIYTSGFEIVGKIVLELVEILGITVQVSGIWLHFFVLGFFYILVDVRGFWNSRRDLAYAVLYLTICFPLITVSAIYVDNQLLGIENTLEAQISIFAVWLAAIAACEFADIIQTAFWPSVRKEWSAYYECGDDDIWCLFKRGSKRVFIWQIITPLFLILPTICIMYESDRFSEGTFGIVLYLIYLMGYWILNDLGNYSRAGNGQQLVEFMEKSYNWRLGIGLFAGAVTVVLSGIVGLAYK